MVSDGRQIVLNTRYRKSYSSLKIWSIQSINNMKENKNEKKNKTTNRLIWLGIVGWSPAPGRASSLTLKYLLYSLLHLYFLPVGPKWPKYCWEGRKTVTCPSFLYAYHDSYFYMYLFFILFFFQMLKGQRKGINLYDRFNLPEIYDTI